MKKIMLQMNIDYGLYGTEVPEYLQILRKVWLAV